MTNLLSNNGYTNLKLISTPVEANSDLNVGSIEFDNPKEYRKMAGSLQYLTTTRPDVCYAVSKFAQYMEKSKQVHWITLKSVLRYLFGTQTKGILIRRAEQMILTGYSDVDWATDMLSYSGYLIYLGKSLIVW